MFWFGVVSYGIAAVAYGVTAIIIVASRPAGFRATLLTSAMVASSLWAVGLALSFGVSLPLPLLIGFDAIHLLVWTLCVLSWLSPPSAGKWLASASAAVVGFAVAASWSPAAPAVVGWMSYPALVLMALIAFLALEQVYRNAQAEIRHQLKTLCIATGAIAALDLFVYSHATLLGAPQPLFWAARGLGNAVVLPLIVLGAKRQSGWERELFVSRHVMFYTASLLGVGVYLVAMGLVAYVIRASGRQWSFPLDLAFLAAGFGVLVVALFSAGIRARIKVFVIKHFYRTKYDYREAWLRLTQSLSRIGDLQESAANGLDGMARIIGSQRGDLWLEQDAQRYHWLVSLGGGQPAVHQFERQHPLVAFLSTTGWVIDSEQYADEPDRYGTAFGHPNEGVLPQNALIVPLDRQGHLLGFVVLGKPPGLRSLNFEDHDILKTAGRQVAAVLAQALVQEKLAETRQFEALNKMSAFLMHDLKNIVAQQDLVLGNAERFRHRPEFIDDAFMTIRSGTDRIKKVLEQLSAATRSATTAGRVDVSKVLMEVRSQCADRQPIPQLALASEAVWVPMDREKLTSVVSHLVRNAQDATAADGRISIELARQAAEVVITISDTGCGMDPVFLRDRLFRPFDSTKGAAGMGIGAYQARHIVQTAGGHLAVTSDLGKGSTFTVRLPSA